MSGTRALVAEAAASPAAAGGLNCPKGHPLSKGMPPSRWGCDGCSNVNDKETAAYSCRACNVDFCGKCAAAMAPEAAAAGQVDSVANTALPTGEGAPHIVTIAGKRVVNWRRLRELLGWRKSDADEEKRKKIFNMIDVNGNGIVSLAEVDKGMRDILQIDEIFNCKPVMLRAFNAAKGVHQGVEPPGNLHQKCRALSVNPIDYVERCEFRVLLVYLYHYFLMYEIFDMLDTDGDHRLSRDEITAALPLLKKMGLNTENPAALFAEMDGDGAGMILFKEFSDYLLKKEVAHKIKMEGDYE